MSRTALVGSSILDNSFLDQSTSFNGTSYLEGGRTSHIVQEFCKRQPNVRLLQKHISIKILHLIQRDIVNARSLCNIDDREEQFVDYDSLYYFWTGPASGTISDLRKHSK